MLNLSKILRQWGSTVYPYYTNFETWVILVMILFTWVSYNFLSWPPAVKVSEWLLLNANCVQFFCQTSSLILIMERINRNTNIQVLFSFLTWLLDKWFFLMEYLYQIYNTYKSSYTETKYFIDIELICVFRFLASSTIRDKAWSIYKNNGEKKSEYN